MHNFFIMSMNGLDLFTKFIDSPLENRDFCLLVNPGSLLLSSCTELSVISQTGNKCFLYAEFIGEVCSLM